MRTLAKSLVRAVACAAVLPNVIVYYLKSVVIGRDRALHGSTQTLSLIPGLPGRYLRVAFLRCVLRRCDPSASIEFGCVLSQASAEIGRNVYVGPGCYLGWVILEDDVLLASGVQVPSGPNTHGTERLDIPIREQPGRPVPVRIGAGTWVGSASVVMAEVGAHSIVAAGSVVTRPLPAFCIGGGVPARVLRDRREQADAAAGRSMKAVV